MPLIAFNDLSSAVGKSRLLCEGLWGRAFLSAYNCANDGERLRMTEGLGKGAGLALLAVPMVEVFTFTLVQLPRPRRSDLRSAYTPLRWRHDARPHARDSESSASMPSAREELRST